jgi:phosphate transport system protein
MTTHLQQELENISQKIFQMADLAIESIQNAVTSLKNVDTALAESVIQKDANIDQLEISIDEDCIRVLVTKQPAAADLRLVLAILKANTDLERIGDLSTSIAKETIRLDGRSPLKPLVDIPRMSEMAINMIKMSFRSFTEKNTDLAHECIELDRQIDDLNMQVYRELFSFMAENHQSACQAQYTHVPDRCIELDRQIDDLNMQV